MSLHSLNLYRILLSERSSLLRVTSRIVGSVTAAEDVLQRLWLKVDKIEDPEPIRNPKAYLFRLASNLAVDHVRAESTRNRIQSQADAYLWGPAESVSVEHELIAREALERVMSALKHLPEPTQTMFRLNRFEGMTLSQIAQRYSVSTTTVEKHIRRALGVLRQARDDE
ncbi:MAG: RNA polymerase sigma factor [Asticcacaulis sp.]